MRTSGIEPGTFPPLGVPGSLHYSSFYMRHGLTGAYCDLPKADFVLRLRVRRHVTHSVHGLHQLSQVWLDLDRNINAQMRTNENKPCEKLATWRTSHSLAIYKHNRSRILPRPSLWSPVSACPSRWWRANVEMNEWRQENRETQDKHAFIKTKVFTTLNSQHFEHWIEWVSSLYISMHCLGKIHGI